MNNVIQGNLSVHWCKEAHIKLREHNKTRWLEIEAVNGTNYAKITLFFDTKVDEENIIKSLYSELVKIQSKKEILFRKFS